MRVAVFSDIHGNGFALEAALADIERRGADQLVCLGDTLQGGAQPAATVARLRALDCRFVMGNADAWLLTEDERDTAEETTTEQRDVRAWTLPQLSADDLAFLRGFAPTVEIDLGDGQRLLCFHGSPTSFDDILLPESSNAEFAQVLGGHGTALLTGGHTHVQQVRHVGEGLFFNPGSVGLVFHGGRPADATHLDPWAEYALVTAEQGQLSLEFRRVPYDVTQLVATIRASGRPHAESLVARFLLR